MASQPLQVQARNMVADALAVRGPAWRVTAERVRLGLYANLWLEAAVDAVQVALREGPDDEA